MAMFDSEAAVLEKHFKNAELKDKMKKEQQMDAQRFLAEEKKKQKKFHCCSEDEDEDEDEDADAEGEDEVDAPTGGRAAEGAAPVADANDLEAKYRAAVLRSTELERQVADLAYRAALLADELEDAQDEAAELRHAGALRRKEAAFQRSQVTSLSQECELLRRQGEAFERLAVESGLCPASPGPEPEVRILVTGASEDGVRDSTDVPPGGQEAAETPADTARDEEAPVGSPGVQAADSSDAVFAEAAQEEQEVATYAVPHGEEEASGDAPVVRPTEESPAAPPGVQAADSGDAVFSQALREELEEAVGADAGGQAAETTCLDDGEEEVPVAVVDCPDLDSEPSARCTVELSQSVLQRLCLLPEDLPLFEQKMSRLLDDHDQLLKELMASATRPDPDGASNNTTLSKDAENRFKRHASRLEEGRRKIEVLEARVAVLQEEVLHLKKRREEESDEHLRADRKRLHKEVKETHHEVDEVKEENASLMKKFEKFKKSIRMPWAS